MRWKRVSWQAARLIRTQGKVRENRLQRVDHLIIGAQTHHSHLAVVEQPRRNEDCADPFLTLLFGPVNGNAGSE